MAVWFYPGQEDYITKLNELGAIAEMLSGPDGWSPVLGVVSDGGRRVFQVTDWVGGETTKPDVGQYVGSTGYVTDIADAVDIRGPQGDDGDDGPANVLSIGTVTGGITADATITGTSPSQVLNLVLPQGAQGDPGVDGVDGEDGAAATITVGTVTTGAPGTSASITNVGSASAAVFDFTIPRGDAGAGSGDVIGPTSSTDNAIALFDGTDGKLLKSGGVLASVATSGSYNDLTDKPTVSVADWDTLENKPAVIAAGATAADARTVIGAGTSNLVLGTTAGTALEGNTPIPAAQQQTDWNAPSGITAIANKPPVIAAGADAAAARAVIGALGDALSDGKLYARKDAEWVEITGGGGVDVVATPINVSPATAAMDIGETPVLTGSAYGNAYGFPKASGRWQVSTVSNFSTTVVDSGDVAGTGVTYTVPGSLLVVSTVYYWRVMYKDNQGNSSQWSTPTSFTTASAFNSYIPTPAPTPAVGAAFEGGFYSGGMIWNEIAQSATSTVIGTGSKVFTVPDMTGAPIVYAGQSVEVRSRANPANKMIGTVTGAIGAALTVNVTGVGGSGAFTDWSVMSRFRVIVAPKAFGENASLAYQNAATSAPAATVTLTEGRRATLAMVGAGTSTVYPAAHWCNSLNIGGKTDWYLPARDELELCSRNLKPTTDANYTAARSNSTYNYANLGSYGDTAAAQGLNNNSAPVGAAYTADSPAQTAATAFRTGGAEAFDSYYWSSTEYSTSAACMQLFGSSNSGAQSNSNKTGLIRVRAIRRSII